MRHHIVTYTGDPHSLHGAWSPPTSRANFCEEDYSLSAYIAEFINTLTNLTYVYYALRHIHAKRRIDFMSFSLLTLGICSSLFHATLLLPLEFSDELAMLGLAWSILQGFFTFNINSAKNKFIINTLLSLFFVSFSAYYVYSAKIIYHSIVFTSFPFLLMIRGVYLFYGPKAELLHFPAHIRADWVKRTYKIVGLLVFAYTLWGIDLEFCAQLRELKAWVGLPWAWLFEFHGWWHIFTGMVAARFMEIIREMEAEAKLQQGKEKEH
ncbi:ceramidase [Cladorrhinum sp. PSN332]|nr:ceramidase [Cladorrhinum sp. PSN332]